MKISCEVIRDLLPLYHDRVCSPESSALVEEHLTNCEPCQELYHQLQENEDLIPVPEEARETKRAEALKQVKRVFTRKRIAAIVLAVVITLAVGIPLLMLASIPIVVQPASVVREVRVEGERLFIAGDGWGWDSFPSVGYGFLREDGEEIPVAVVQYAASPMKIAYQQLFKVFEGDGQENAPPSAGAADSMDMSDGSRSLRMRKELEARFSPEEMVGSYEPYGVAVGEWYDEHRNDPIPEEFRIRRVYYYDGISAGLWRKTPQEEVDDLPNHGTLLWSREENEKK